MAIPWAWHLVEFERGLDLRLKVALELGLHPGAAGQKSVAPWRWFAHHGHQPQQWLAGTGDHNLLVEVDLHGGVAQEVKRA